MIRKKRYQKMTRHTLMAAYIFIIALLTASCSVHEFPDEEKEVRVALQLKFTTDMPWSTFVSDNLLQSSGNRSLSQATQVRCIMRFYKQTGSTRNDVSADYQEFVYTTTVYDSCDNEVAVDVVPGNYLVMVWADLIHDAAGHSFYDATDFSDIKVQFPYHGNTDYRDAFRGTAEISQSDFYEEGSGKTFSIEMTRPLAKYEFISTDLKEFLLQETKAQTKSDSKSAIDLNSYRILFFYDGYMPTSYSLFTDKPIDATTGVSFEGSFNLVSDEEVSLGFDYVFVNHKETTITVKIGLFNQAGELVSLTKPIDVPLKRSTHTLMRGRYLMEKANSSVSIDPSYDDEYNIIF